MATSCCPLLLLILTSVACAALPPPPYMTPCATSSPDFQKCALENGRKAIPYLVKGDRKYRIPPLEPARVAEIKVQQGPGQAGFTLDMSDVSVHGLSRVRLEDSHYDFLNKRLTFAMLVPRLEVEGRYKISGRIMVLPITGQGDFNITLVDCKIQYNETYDVIDNRFVSTSADTDVDPKMAHIRMTNLFGGDKLLGEQMNQFMNENWKEVFREVAPTIASAFGHVGAVIINRIGEAIPFDDLFPETLPP